MSCIIPQHSTPHHITPHHKTAALTDKTDAASIPLMWDILKEVRIALSYYFSEDQYVRIETQWMTAQP